MPTKAKHPTAKDLRQGKVLYQVHDQNRDGEFEVRVVKIYSIPLRTVDKRAGQRTTSVCVKCDMPMFDFDGKPLKLMPREVAIHQLVDKRHGASEDSTFGSYLFTTRRAAENKARELNAYVARQPKYIHTIGVYPNGEFLQGIKTNSVAREHIVGHVHYNLDWRPGRALIVNNKIVYDGNVDRDKLKQIIAYFKENPPRLDRDSAPYQ